MLSFFPRGVLDEILNLIESVSEDFPSYSYKCRAIYALDFRSINKNIYEIVPYHPQANGKEEHIDQGSKYCTPSLSGSSVFPSFSLELSSVASQTGQSLRYSQEL